MRSGLPWQDRPLAADRLVDAIHTRCGVLLRSPRSGRRRNELSLGLRSVVHKGYVVFYRQDDEGVWVVRVLSGDRDLDALLAE